MHKHVSLLKDATGEPTSIVVLVTDITERKRYEEHIELLLHEVNHRSKTCWRSSRPWRGRPRLEPQRFRRTFGERIQAMAAAQDLLVKNEWRGVDLDGLVRSQLAHFNDLIGTRIEIEGPDFCSRHPRRRPSAWPFTNLPPMRASTGRCPTRMAAFQSNGASSPWKRAGTTS